MKKSQATNTFNKGMIMDLNPIVTPNDVLTNCLNGTLVTFNGNENVLQNDMGNGRVETAYLPEGYVPLGTAELGGVIYIVSYNPLKNKCQIGSFPSPERNISSDEISNIVCSLSEEDFHWDATNGAYVYYLKKDLDSELTFNPGDKFIVYGNNLLDNYSNFYDASKYSLEDFDEASKQTIKLDIGTITDTGRLVKFSDLKQYQLQEGKTYHIYEYEGSKSGTTKPDLDEYRNLVSQPYNIFNSKVSGRLVLIAELVQCNTFDIEISHVFTKDENSKQYIPNVTFNFGGEYPFIPTQVKCNLEVADITEEVYIDITEKIKETINSDNQNYSVLVENILSNSKSIKTIIDSINFNEKDRDYGYILKYTFTPCMNWGPISYLAVSGSIDLDKLGTGYIGLTTWRYYKQNSMSLTWGLEVYEEEGYNVTSVLMEFVRPQKKADDTFEKSEYTVSKKASYHGIFYDILPLDQTYFRLSNPLVSNTLYLVKIIVTYAKTEENASTKTTAEKRVFYRWMYTNEVFNSYYASTTDFIGLTLSFDPTFSMNYTSKTTDKNQSTIYGVINPSTEGKSDEDKTKLKDSKASLSCIQTLRDSNINCELSVGLEKTYNTFYLECKKEAFSLGINKEELDCTTSASIKYTDREDSNQDSYLFSFAKIVDSLTNYKLESSSDIDKSDTLLGTDENPFPTNALHLKTDSINSNFKDNIYSFQIQYEALQMVKAYCIKLESSLTYSGRLLPLAYDNDSFELYNLKYVSGNMEPIKLGTYGFHETGGKDGYVYVGHADSSTPEHSETQVEGDHDDVDLNWTTDEDIISAEQTHGWTNTAIFAVHWSGGNGSRQHTFSKPANSDNWIYSEAMDEWYGNHGNTRVQLMLKSNNSLYFYPIDFSLASRASDYSSLLSLQKELYNSFAQVLGNLYRYDNEVMSTACLIPQSIYYMDNCIYGLVLPLSIRSEDDLHDCNVQLQLDDDKVNLNEITTILASEIEEGKTEKSFKNNLTYTINDINSTYKFNIANSDKTSGISLRNYMLDCQTTVQGIGIMDYNGKDLIGNSAANFNNTKLYYIVKGNPVIVKAATNVPFKQINYSIDSSGNLVVTMTDNKLEDSKENLNSRFQLNDGGLLILKDPPSSEYEMKRDGNDDTGNVRGFQKARLLNKYRYYS